jgi:hypothetical protein
MRKLLIFVYRFGTWLFKYRFPQYLTNNVKNNKVASAKSNHFSGFDLDINAKYVNSIESHEYLLRYLTKKSTTSQDWRKTRHCTLFSKMLNCRYKISILCRTRCHCLSLSRRLSWSLLVAARHRCWVWDVRIGFSFEMLRPQPERRTRQ